MESSDAVFCAWSFRSWQITLQFCSHCRNLYDDESDDCTNNFKVIFIPTDISWNMSLCGSQVSTVCIVSKLQLSNLGDTTSYSVKKWGSISRANCWYVNMITYLQTEPKLRKSLTIILTTYTFRTFTETALHFYVFCLHVKCKLI